MDNSFGYDLVIPHISKRVQRRCNSAKSDVDFAHEDTGSSSL